MKPLRLRMQAFGPYATEMEIDFSELKSGGLFLIHGPTGAGKTSILDGICFSLFGKSSGSERAADGLRCDLAKPELATEAELEFSLGLTLYKVIRRPRQSVKKTRGEGTREVPSKGELYEQKTGEWHLLISGDKKTDEKIIELIGMSEEQFRQVVVLPQGQFRKFLSSTSEDREVLLETLFRTSHYRELTDRLQSRAAKLAASIQLEKKSLTAQLSSYGCTNLEDLKAQIDLLEKELLESSVADGNFEKNFIEAQRRLEKARAVVKDRSELVVFRARASALDDKRHEIEHIANLLRFEKLARPVLLLDTQVVHLQSSISELQIQIRLDNEKLQKLETQVSLLVSNKDELDKREVEMGQLTRERAKLEDTYRDIKAFEIAKKKEATTLLIFQTASEQFRTQEQGLSQVRQARDLTNRRIDELALQIQGLNPLRLELQKEIAEVEQLRSDIERVEKLIVLCSQAELNSLAADRNLQDVAEKFHCLKLNYHLSQAALLARTLKPDEPCPVCGSAEHPRPAPSDPIATVDLHSLDEFEAQVKKATELFSISRVQVENFRSDLTGRLAQLESIEIARSRFQKREKELLNKKSRVQELETTEHDLGALRAQLGLMDTEYQLREKAERQSAASLNEKSSSLALVRAEIERLETILPPDLRDLTVITERGQTLRRQLDEYKNLVRNTEAQLQSCREEFAGCRSQIEMMQSQLNIKQEQVGESLKQRDQALTTAGIETVEVARSYALKADESISFETKKTQFDNEWSAVKSRLTDLEQDEKSWPSWALDLTAIENEFAAADSARNQAQRRTAVVGEKIASLTDSFERFASLNKQLLINEDQYSTIGKLAAVAAGLPPHNLTRVNFSRYVLAARLDEVLEQASRRLYLMSRGQFLLRRSKNAEDRRRNAGLDLEVEDSFTGTSRPTASLSGGEGFLASLALALGLADVVQSRLGGIRLDAVFVDEGFGTLDAEALELAIKTLSELQAGGRIVGIISHVPELREQILRRLTVSKTQLGSSVKWE